MLDEVVEEKIFVFSKARITIIPSTPQERISPIPTVTISTGIGSGAPYPYLITNGTSNAFAIIGGNGANFLCLRME